MSEKPVKQKPHEWSWVMTGGKSRKEIIERLEQLWGPVTNVHINHGFKDGNFWHHQCVFYHNNIGG